MLTSTVDKKSSSKIMTPDEVAAFCQKSTSWVYAHWEALGGVKLGGSLLFPNKEDLYELLFNKRQRKGVEVRLHPEGNQVHGSLVRNKNKGNRPRPKSERR